MPKIVLLNGPPRCGKDTAAVALTNAIPNSVHHKFADPLRNAVPAMFGIGHDLWQTLYLYNKDVRTSVLFGMSPREAMIWLSEEVMKPKFGVEVFGKIAAQTIASYPQETVVVSDSGFAREVMPLIDAFGVDNLLIVQIRRPGQTFDGDSRGWVDLPAVTTWTVFNDSTVESFEVLVLDAVFWWLHGNDLAA